MLSHVMTNAAVTTAPTQPVGFRRIRFLLAAFDRNEFGEVGLSKRLTEYVDRAATVSRPSRKATVVGMPAVLWSEP